MASAGRRIIVYNIETDTTSETESLKAIVESGISGLVAWIDYDTPANRKYLASLTQRHFPVVLADRYLEGLDVDHAVSANEDIGYRLTRALLESGHKRIAFAGHKEDLSSVNDRFKGYQRALQEVGLLHENGHGAQSTNHRFQLDLEHAQLRAREAVGEVMSLRDRPTAFICINDLFADRVHKQLVRLGFAIPGDIELAAVDDDHPIGHDRPPMVRIVQQAYEVGAQSAELLLARMADPGVPVQRRYIQAGPILREGETRMVGSRQERREEEKSMHIFSEARAGE
jgi:LacI family transcriptional regulator